MCVQHYPDTEDPLTSATAKSMDKIPKRGYFGHKLLYEIYHRKIILSKSAMFTMTLRTYNTWKKIISKYMSRRIFTKKLKWGNSGRGRKLTKMLDL